MPVYTLRDKKTGKLYTVGNVGGPLTMKSTIKGKKLVNSFRDDDVDQDRAGTELNQRYTRVEKTVDNTVVYKDNVTGDTIFRQTIKGRTYFQREKMDG